MGFLAIVLGLAIGVILGNIFKGFLGFIAAITLNIAVYYFLGLPGFTEADFNFVFYLFEGVAFLAVNGVSFDGVDDDSILDFDAD